MNGIDLTKQDIRVCDELICENGYINAVYECWFDVEKYFNKSIGENEWFNVYTNWYPDGNIKILVHIDSDDGIENLPFELNEDEKKFLINKMEEACKQQCGMSLSEFYEFIENEWR